MKLLFLVLSFLSILGTFGTLKAEDILLIVQAKGGLKLRTEPNLNSKVITVIPEGEIVQYIESTDASYTVDDIDGDFFKIQWKGNVGYSFGGYLYQGFYREPKFSYFLIEKQISPTGNVYFSTYTADTTKKDCYRNLQECKENCNVKYGKRCIVQVRTMDGKLVFQINRRDIELNNELGGAWIKWIDDDRVYIDDSWGDDIWHLKIIKIFSIAQKRNVWTVVNIDTSPDPRNNMKRSRDIIICKLDSCYIIDHQGKKGTLSKITGKNKKKLQTLEIKNEIKFIENFDSIIFSIDDRVLKINPENDAIKFE